MAEGPAPAEGRVETLLQEWREDPARFFKDLTGDDPDPQQVEAMELVRDNRKVCIPSGHGCGKTRLAAVMAVWFFATHKNAKVITTAPTWPQVKTVLWAEIHKCIQDSWVWRVADVGKTAMNMLDRNGRTLEHWYVYGRSASVAENFQGFHSENILIIFDEGSGIPDHIMDALEGTQTTANVKMLAIGNPTRRTGWFADVINRIKKGWQLLRFNSEDSSLVTKEWIEERREDWGPDYMNDDRYRVRVLGLLPRRDAYSLFDADAIQVMRERHSPVKRDRVDLGVDVARYGDDLTIYTVKITGPNGHRYEYVETEKVSTVTGIASRIHVLNELWGFENIAVDDTGVGGGVVDILLNNETLNHKVVPVRFGAKAQNKPDEQLNMKAEIFWEAAESVNKERWSINPEISGHHLDELSKQLLEISYKFTTANKLVVEDYLKVADSRRGTTRHKSPDYADSFALAHYASIASRVNRLFSGINVTIHQFDLANLPAVWQVYGGLVEHRGFYYAVWVTMGDNDSLKVLDAARVAFDSHESLLSFGALVAVPGDRPDIQASLITTGIKIWAAKLNFPGMMEMLKSRAHTQRIVFNTGLDRVLADLKHADYETIDEHPWAKALLLAMHNPMRVHRPPKKKTREEKVLENYARYKEGQNGKWRSRKRDFSRRGRRQSPSLSRGGR